MKWFLIPLLFASCNTSQYQSLADLKNELNSARKDLSSARDRVVLLEDEIAQKEIARIKIEIENIQKASNVKMPVNRDERIAFFAEQREILAQIIKNHTGCALDAQIVLDQILTFITKMSDTAVE